MLCVVYALLITANISAGLIDFEKTALGGQPTDNGTIEFSDAFMADGVTVRFGFDTDSDGTLDAKAVFEEAGNVDIGDDTGFWGIDSARDVAAPGYTDLLGDFFLRQSDPYEPFGIFTILYETDRRVTAASGEIWDIDGNVNKGKTEQFLVQAFNGSTLLDSRQSPLGVDKTLNGLPWTFGFDGLSDITKINITFIGSKTSGIGLAFNNFSPVEDISEPINVPEPSTLALLVLGAMGVASRRLRKLP